MRGSNGWRTDGGVHPRCVPDGWRVGATRGRGDAKLTYGDDKVHVCILTGFKYRALCERSLDELNEMDIVTLAANAAKILEGKLEARGEGLKIFQNGVDFAAGLSS